MPLLETFGNASVRGFRPGSKPLPVVTGGTLSSDATYYYRKFTASATLYISAAPLNADILMVAGGGGGGGGFARGGGGGAGGVLFTSGTTLTVGNFSIVIGGGGAQEADGNNTTFTSLSNAIAGGRGAGAVYSTGAGNGGSGGGGRGSAANSPGGTGTAGQGFAGGNQTTGNTGNLSNPCSLSSSKISLEAISLLACCSLSFSMGISCNFI
jgi:hypothetical protein